MPIREIEVGQAIPTVGNPVEGEDLQFGRVIVPDQWRRIDLIADTDDGGRSEITLLRPLWWLQQQNAFRGGTVYISVPHCGIESWTRVVEIGPCPDVEQRDDARIVTGTFRHGNKHVIDVHLADQSAPIGATGNHPFWSEHRQAFIRADELQVGEILRTSTGTTTVTALTPRPGRHEVFNLEVQLDHVYQVTTDGLLVHNGSPCNVKTLSDWLEDNPELLAEVRQKFQDTPEWQGIDPDRTPVFYRPGDVVQQIRNMSGESGGHHPHGLALGGPEGQNLTPTTDTRTNRDPVHSAATGLQRRIINHIKKKL